MQFSRIIETVGCALLTPAILCACAAAPQQQQDVCQIFEQQPRWFDHAMKAEERWGVPAHVLLSFVHFESGFQARARPPRDWFLFVPLPRKSSAYGYAQAQDPAWQEYKQETDAGWLSDRDNMKDALDFIGWYNRKSHEELGISVWDPKHLYIAYHEGRAGYRSGAWRGKPDLIRHAEQVDWQAREYGAQLRQCKAQFSCDAWYQFPPFCRAPRNL